MDRWTRTGRTLALASLTAVFAALTGAAPVAAVDTIYWADQGTNEIRYAPADGSAPAGTLLYASENVPDGIALDPSTGRIYWASEGTGEIRTGLLSGGAPASTLYSGETELDGLAVDPVSNRIYWATGDTVRGAPLAGGGTVDSVHPGQQQVQGVAADVAGDLLYWTLNFFEGGNVMRGPFGGGGDASLYGPESGPSFVAVDSAANGVWWTTIFNGIRAGTPGGAAATTVYGENFGEGIVADTAAGRLYWAVSMDGPSEIHSAPIAGGGTVSKVADARGARGIALLRSPLNTVAPVVSPTSGPTGTVLSCSTGTWSIGVPGAFVYRAPTSFTYQWHRNGADLSGETNPTHTAATPGTYRCTVTGINQAGATPQLSSNEAVIADPARNPPVVTLSPDQHDFGSRPLDDDDPPRQAFTVENSGGSTATITSLAVAGADATAFDMVSSDCGATLAPGASCEAVIAFNPGQAGARSASLEVKSDGGDDASALTGVGLVPDRPPAPAPIPADLDLLVANNVVLHRPFAPTRCRTSRRTRLRRCRVQMFTLGGKPLGSSAQNAGASQSRGKRNVGVPVRVNRRGRRRVAPALGGVPVRLRAVGRLTDGRRLRAGNRTRLFAERHHLVPPAAGIFKPDQPILLPSGRRFLRSIAARARRVDVIQCHGHAAELPFRHVNPVFAASLALARAHVACNFLRNHGMNGKFVKIGHSNRLSRNPGLDRQNPASWPPDRRSGVVLIRH
jgi:PKD repeat protein